MDNKNEAKSARFRRLAEKRTKRVLNDIRILSNLANRGLYNYSPDQLRKVFSAIRKALAQAEGRFKGEEKEGIEFEL